MVSKFLATSHAGMLALRSACAPAQTNDPFAAVPPSSSRAAGALLVVLQGPLAVLSRRSRPPLVSLLASPGLLRLLRLHGFRRVPAEEATEAATAASGPAFGTGGTGRGVTGNARKLSLQRAALELA